MLPELPPETAPWVTAVGVIVAGVLVGWKYFKVLISSEKPSAVSPEVQIVGGALADRTATMELVRAIDGLTAQIKISNELLQHQTQEDEIKRMIAEHLSRLASR
jgi:hypothetical protein